jgi:hypothetical protein
MAIQELQDNKAVELLSAALTLTAAWQDIGTLVGPIIHTADYDLAALWVRLDINDSTGVQFRVLASPTKEFTNSYVLPIQDVAASLVGVTPEVFELSNDVDQNIILPFSMADIAPYVKFQVQTTVVGASAGQILSAKVAAKTTGSATGRA